jgi:hypothetical protein
VTIVAGDLILAAQRGRVVYARVPLERPGRPASNSIDRGAGLAVLQ